MIRTVPEYLKALKDKSQIPDIKFYSDEETVSLIVKERKSLSRFGDGEFMWMSGERISSFQDYSAEFARDLTLALKTIMKTYWLEFLTECLIHPNAIFMRKCIGELFVPIFFPD